MDQYGNVLSYYSKECDIRQQFVECEHTPLLEFHKYSYQLAPSLGQGWMDMFQICHGVTIGRTCFFTPFECLATESPGMIAIFIVLSGRLEVKDGNGLVLEGYEKGDVAIGYRHNMSETHISYLPQSKVGKVEVVSIDIPIDFFNQLFYSRDTDLSILYSIQKASCLVHSDHVCRHCAISVAQDILALDCNKISDLISVESSLLGFVNTLASHFEHLYPAVGDSLSPRYASQVQQVVHTLERDYQQKHTIASLSREAGLNECYLKVAFKEQTGLTIAEFHRRTRLTQAKRFLETTSLSILEVVHKVGYSNPGHFSAAFRQQFGVAPSVVKLK
ncbi:helix-turn-helix transcriptional regulator [Vibrio coralliilyticus]|uniref:helix-turn-helix transcriptional regulator n=1 Tax=Vibrio coralliilyticus TaxID=190893 RepID=UPI00148CA9AC|nr:AraC family transcriptional regulator [Vibrio coralliilyticus]